MSTEVETSGTKEEGALPEATHPERVAGRQEMAFAILGSIAALAQGMRGEEGAASRRAFAENPERALLFMALTLRARHVHGEENPMQSVMATIERMRSTLPEQ